MNKLLCKIVGHQFTMRGLNLVGEHTKYCTKCGLSKAEAGVTPKEQEK